MLGDRRDADATAFAGNITTFEDFNLGAIDGPHDWKSLGGLGAPTVSPAGAHCAVYAHEITGNMAAATPYRFHDFERRSLRISYAVFCLKNKNQTLSSRTSNAAGQAHAQSRNTNGLIVYARVRVVLQIHFVAILGIRSTVPD